MGEQMKREFEKINEVKGELELPGDKSISHRAVMFSCLAGGVSEISNLSGSEDVKSTVKCFENLGCGFNKDAAKLIVTGKGFKNFSEPHKALYAGNSGTTARLITGILVAQKFKTRITGDESLSRRPMERIIKPLRQMGAKIEASDGNTLPVTVYPVENLKPVKYELPVPSAQVKSSVLLAGLHLEGETKIIETVPSRNHTENMLNLKIETDGNRRVIFVSRKNYPAPDSYFVPSDISTAAFFIVLTLLAPKGEILIKNVLLNETRSGVLEILKRMGGKISILDKRISNNEPYGDLLVSSSTLHNIGIPAEIIPNIIDEIPVISLAGIFAEGNFRIENCKELRYKESDRIKALCENYRKLGIEVNEFEDGFELTGYPQKLSGNFDSYGDHRIAMTFAIASVLLPQGGTVDNFEYVKISNPDFIKQLEKISV